MNNSGQNNDIGGLRVYFKKEGYAEIDSHGNLTMSFEGTTASRSIREWTDMVRQETSGEPTGTMRCPVCNLDFPHGHDDALRVIELKFRPAFEEWVYRAIQVNGLKSVTGIAIADGYWWGIGPTDARARYDGGWAERTVGEGGIGKLAPYKYKKLQVMWEVWQAACLTMGQESRDEMAEKSTDE